MRYLDGYTNRGVLPGLERIAWLCAQLAHPERAAPAVHITGTNGKGSTARLISALLTAERRRTGLYTSPHLCDITERIVIGEEPISHRRFAQLMRDLAPLFDQVTANVNFGPTHFEILTTLGLAAFAAGRVDAMVVEVGLGGRWDTTNVVDGSVAVITNVDVDHTNYLGARREDQAFEKAGIIKAGAIAVIGETAQQLVEIIKARCDEVGAACWKAGDEFALTADRAAEGGRVISVRTPAGDYRDVPVPFHGSHQARNAACALAATEAFLGEKTPAEVTAGAWRNVANPGPALIEALREKYPDKSWVVVIGINPDKDASTMLDLLRPHVRVLITTHSR